MSDTSKTTSIVLHALGISLTALGQSTDLPPLMRAICAAVGLTCAMLARSLASMLPGKRMFPPEGP
ncbi:MAG TPA: hypothetical protein VEA41_01875 [Salinarimonas sp.]|nr:hypothetical protein [Salinarimonas sp.]